MKKKFLFSIVSLLSLAMLAGCSTDSSSTSSNPDSSYNSSTGTSSPDSSSSSTSTSSSTSNLPESINSITITNEEALQARWLTTDSYRSINITTDPVFNQAQAINEGRLTVTSSHPDIIATSGLVINPMSSGEAKITVAYGNVSATIDIAVYDNVTMLPTNDVVSVGSSISFAVTSTSERNEATDYNWTSSDSEIATVNENGVVTGVKEGSVTIRATDKAYEGNYAEYTITVGVETITSIANLTSTLLSSQAVTIEGEIVALTTRGFLTTDGTGTVYYYLNSDPSATYSIGDHVKIRNVTTANPDGSFSYSGASSYNGLVQFANTSTVALLSSKWDGTVAEAEELTAETADGFVGSSFSTTDVKKYKWKTVTGLLNGYTTINLDGSTTVMEPSYMPDNFSFNSYAYYEVEAYFGGYSSSNSYAAMYITSVTPLEVTENLLSISSYDVSVYAESTASVTIVNLTPNGSTDTVSVVSNNEEVATIAKVEGSDYDYTITGVSVGTTTITVTLGTIVKTIDVTVLEELKITEIKDIVLPSSGTETILFQGKITAHNNYNSFIVDDGTGAVIVYNSSIASDYKVGDAYLFEGTITNYFGTPEVTDITNATALSAAEAAAITPQANTALTDDVLNAFKDYNSSNPIPTTMVKPYTFTGIVTNKETHDVTLNVNGSEVRLISVSNQKSIYDSLEVGKGYDITAYFYGHHSNGYIQALTMSATLNEDVGGGTTETLPDPIDITISNLVAGNVQTNTLYSVSGIMEGWKGDEYGKGYLTDPITGASIMVYGATVEASADDAFTVTNGSVSWDNPKNANETLADMKDGYEVTMNVVYTLYNSTPEIMGIVTEYGASENTYTVNVTESENGTVTPDKDAYSYGETVSLTIAPSEGYSVASVSVDHGYTQETLTADEGTYSFSATVVNNVTVSYRDTSVEVTSVTYDFTTAPSFSFSTSALTTDQLNTYFSALSSDADLRATATEKVYYADGENSNSNNGIVGLKFGSSSAAGYVTLTCSKKITSIQFVVSGWSNGAINLSVNDTTLTGTGTNQTLTYTGEIEANTAFTLAQSSVRLTISSMIINFD